MINWKVVIIGFILAVILSILFGAIGGTVGSYIGIIIAGVVVGYMVNWNLMNGAKHGALIGVIAGIILAIFVIVLALAVGGALGTLIILGGALALIVSIVLWAVLGAIGGAIGAAVRNQQMGSMKESTVGSRETRSPGEPKIEFTGENISKCMCPQCPVQAESECAQTQMKMLQESMRGMSPEPSEVPGVYCATGIATCSDLDPNKMCNCPNCDVFKENNLAKGEPGGYFCQKGIAK